jgi:hypothetical protein
MAYNFYIERWAKDCEIGDDAPLPIPFQELQLVVETTENLKFSTNPRSYLVNGEKITVPPLYGDIEVFLRDKNEWRFVFNWDEESGMLSFDSRSTTMNDEVWQTATTLAEKLESIITGQEGEIYYPKN